MSQYLDSDTFARSMCWRVSTKEFDAETLSRRGVSSWYKYGGFEFPLMDHLSFYRIGNRAAAIASHAYLDADSYGIGLAESFADKHDLRFVWYGKDKSWVRPGETSLIVFTPAIDRQGGRMS